MIGRLHLLALRVFRSLPVRARRQVVRFLAPTFTVGAMAFVERDDGHILLVRLAYRERWGVPGGLLQRSETPADAVLRETREEVGLDIVLSSEPAVVVDAEARRVDVVFRASPASGAELDSVAPTSPEIVTAAWFPVDALPELQHETSGALVALGRAARSPSSPVLADPLLRRAAGD